MKNRLILILGIVAFVTGQQVGVADVETRPGPTRFDCPFDYLPCDCSDDGFSFQLNCENVTQSRVEEIFRNANADKPFGHVVLQGNFTQLPANFIGNNLVKEMAIEWRGDTPVLIDRDFMLFSENFTVVFFFSSLHLTSLNLSCLENFSQLTVISLTGAISRLHSMPYLESVQDLYFNNLPLTELYDPKLTPSVGRIDLKSLPNVSDDEKNDFIASFNATLTYLRADFAEFPTKLNALSRLTWVDLTGTGTLMGSNSITGTGDLSTAMYIEFPLETIEDGAFQGDFRNTFLALYGNRLRRFEEGVFRSVLESMANNGVTGQVGLTYGPVFFECDCHLAWLIRDHRRLLPYIFNGWCSNNTRFESLSPEDFIN